jgi:hypothetical protein
MWLGDFGFRGELADRIDRWHFFAPHSAYNSSTALAVAGVVSIGTHDTQIILDIWKAYDMRLERVLGVVECPSFFWCHGLVQALSYAPGRLISPFTSLLCMPLFYQLRERFLIERVLPVLAADDVVDAT